MPKKKYHTRPKNSSARLRSRQTASRGIGEKLASNPQIKRLRAAFRGAGQPPLAQAVIAMLTASQISMLISDAERRSANQTAE